MNKTNRKRITHKRNKVSKNKYLNRQHKILLNSGYLRYVDNDTLKDFFMYCHKHKHTELCSILSVTLVVRGISSLICKLLNE